MEIFSELLCKQKIWLNWMRVKTGAAVAAVAAAAAAAVAGSADTQ